MLNIGAKLKATPSESKNWYRDRYEAVLTQRNFLGIVALCSLMLALVATGIILLLVPAKTVMPFLIQVDDKSGFTQVVDPSSQAQISADDSLRKYFVVKFLKAREGYDSSDIEVNNNTVRLLAVRDIYRQYWTEAISVQNKNSSYVRLANENVRTVKIKAVQFLGSSRASVRLSIEERPKLDSPGTGIQKHYIALISFEFANLNLTLDDLLVNPLGFRVTEYKLEEDSYL